MSDEQKREVLTELAVIYGSLNSVVIIIQGLQERINKLARRIAELD